MTKHSNRPKALIVSPYHALSHAIWTEELQRIVSFIDWDVLQLPARFFNWRIRGNPLALAYEYGDAFRELDLLVVTSMTDLATLRGLLPELNKIPTLIYFHENQFAYPRSNEHHNKSMLEAKMVTLYGALCADYVLFNSAYNRDTFLEGARQMLRKFPDHAPLECVDLIANKAAVLPVPLPHRLANYADRPTPRNNAGRRCLHVAWNHRWEYDKGPERLVKVLEIAAKRKLGCQFFIFGQSFRQVPADFAQLKEKYRTLIAHMGFIPELDLYYRMLRNCDVVISTAMHDFQGLAVLEAIKLGCIPLVPDRLAYREFIPEHFRYPSSLDEIDTECEQLVERLISYQKQLSANGLTYPDTPSQFDDKHMAKRYSAVINHLLAHGRERTGGDTINVT